MITPGAIHRKYTSLVPYLKPLRLAVRETLQPFVDENGYALVSRIKSLESLAEKLESGRYKRWAEVDDLLAFTIVVPTLSEEAKVLDFLRLVFEEVQLKARGSSRKAPDVFRFDGTRFLARLRASASAGRENVEAITFEVQIRSAFEHAWSVTTHALSYKTSTVTWERLRLAAQLKASVEQLDIMILGFEDAAMKIEASEWPIVDAQRRIAEAFNAIVSRGGLPEVMAPKDWSRFSQNVLELVQAAPWARRRNPIAMADAAIEAVEAELAALGTTGAPLSISLWQFTFASLCKAKILGPPLDERWPVITPELEDFYPVVKQFTVRFDLAL